MAPGEHDTYQLLIADDDQEFRDTLKQIFAPRFELLEAASGEEAVEIVQYQRVDVVLLDMHMEVLTGLDTLRIVKRVNAIVPCIIITADVSDALRHDLEQADAYSVLNKPVTRSEVVSTVSSAVSSVYDDPDVLRWGASFN